MKTGDFVPKKQNMRTHLLHCLYVGILLVPLAFANCSKKQDPDVSADSREGSGEIGESDIGGSGYGGSGGSGDERGTPIQGLQTVYFDYDTAKLTSQARTSLEQNAEFIKTKGRTNLTVEGHCDDRGSSEYNLALGERRANTVRNYLQDLGVKSNNMRIVSFGEEKPAVSGNNESAWAKNRRAEFTQK